MPPSELPRIAVIADAHFHDLYADYGFPGIVQNHRQLTFRLLADTARSTRVFNESYFALRYALDDIANRGIRHVVLLGDYSDDGQAETLSGVKRVLDDYTGRFGMRFYATVGNHDIFGENGRHRAKRFLNEDGSYSVVTSDRNVRDRGARAVIESEKMYCAGYPEGLSAMADFGFYPRSDDIHWETPFGSAGDPASRGYKVRSPDRKTTRILMDASYLVEPFPGVWLLMIDANVFVPVNGIRAGDTGDLTDSTSAGWNAMRLHKRFILEWMKDVSLRARNAGKSLLAFSHYPVIDPLDGTVGDELALLGRTGMVNRIPVIGVAEALIDAGIDVHFSGHLHVNDTSRHRNNGGFLINIAMPSLVAFPGAYKILTVGEDQLDVETIGIGAMLLDDDLRLGYEREIVPSRLDAGGMLSARNYGDFLFEHIGHLVGRRYLKREWPKDIVAMVRILDLGDLAILSLIKEPVSTADAVSRLASVRDDQERIQLLSTMGLSMAQLAGVSAMDFLVDWYRLRMGSELASEWIAPERMAVYLTIGALYAAGKWADTESAQSQFQRIFRMFVKYASGLPSVNFNIDRVTGAISGF